MADDDKAQAFMRAVQEMERTRDVEVLVRLFADDADVGNPMLQKFERGRDGARSFWREYLGAFREIGSEFTDTRIAMHSAALEWKSNGALPDGAPLTYRGVSLVDFDDAGRVRRFRTYYDTAAFLPDGSKHVAERGA
jgi:ketosteroid isomerase-like protein